MLPPASALFSPFRLGPLTLGNRVVMAPMTRARAGAEGVPGKLVAEYYAQRATAGLIVSEATQVSRQGKGRPGTPGIHADAQVLGWAAVTDAVHAAGGRIFCQLWHAGRISHPALQPDGALPVAPSALHPTGDAVTEDGPKPFPTPRALEEDEIPDIVDQYAHAADGALRAGFDGVEVHAADGALLDQFLRDGSNRRADRYGGPVANRARLLLEVVEAVAGRWGADRVGIRLSPVSPLNDMQDSDPQRTFGHAVRELDRFGLAYLHCVEGVTQGAREAPGGFSFGQLRRLFRGPYMADNGYDLALAERALRDGATDLVCFGRPFIANPDLVQRLRTGAPLAEPDRATFYGGDARGYTDYPFLDAAPGAG